MADDTVDNIKFFFLVTGQSSDTGTRAGFNGVVQKYVKKLRRRLIAEKKKDTALVKAPGRVRFIHFNFIPPPANPTDLLPPSGIQISELILPTKGGSEAESPTWKEISKFNGEGDAQFDPKTFVDAQNFNVGTASIVHVYHSVRGAPPGSVIELSIFSHAFLEGPVLTNTSDTRASFPANGPTPDQSSAWPGGLPRRTEMDTDCRKRTDFFQNMGEDPTAPSTSPIKSGGAHALEEFVAAFDPRDPPISAFRVFGCNIQDKVFFNGANEQIKSSVFEVLRQAAYLPIRANESRAGTPVAAIGAKIIDKSIGLDQQITISLAQEFQTEREDHNHEPLVYTLSTDADLLPAHTLVDPVFFKDAALPSIDRTWKDIVQFVARRTIDTYGFVAADALQTVPVHAPPPGTSGDLDKDVMQVCPGLFVKAKKPPPCKHFLKFYELYLGFELDDAHYCRFDAVSIGRVRECMANGFFKP